MRTWYILPLFFLLISLIACGAADPDEGTPTAVTTPAEETESPPAEAEELVTDIENVQSQDAGSGNSPIADEEAQSLLFNLSEGSQSEVDAAIERIVQANDRRFVSVFIELIRARQIGLVQYPDADELVTALEALSGQNLGGNWGEWVTWYGGTDLTPPPGFTSWKGRLLAGIDTYFGLFLQDKHPSNIRVEEIQWGGVVLDGIPALNNPNMLN